MGIYVSVCACVGGGGITDMPVLLLVIHMYPGRGVCGYGKIWEINFG